MPHDPVKLLADILTGADAITSFCLPRTQEDLLNDLQLRSAVERQFEIIGEALRRLEKDAPEVAFRISEYRRIIAFRNIIAHGYDILDPVITWQAATRKLPILRAETQKLLDELAPPEAP